MFRKTLNIIISKIKGETFIFDENIPISYIVGLLCYQFISLVWGMIRFHTLKFIIVSPDSTVKCISKIRFGKNLRIGRRCYIDALSLNGLNCGNNVSIGYDTHIELTGSLKYLGKGMTIGNNVGLGTHGHYGSGMGELIIGDDTIFGNYVSIHPENHNYKDPTKPIRLQGVTGQGVSIGRNCWIGAKATILDGTVIGEGSIVAAGAVVKGIFPPHVIIGGIPAKIIRKL